MMYKYYFYLKYASMRSAVFIQLILVWLIAFHGSASAMDQPAKLVRAMWTEIHEARNDSSMILLLGKLSHFYYDYLGNPSKADSIGDLAVDLAERTYRPGLRLLAFNIYLESNDLSRNYLKALNYAKQAEKISASVRQPDQEWRTIKNLTEVYLAGYQYEQAIQTAFRVLAIAGTVDDPALEAESYLLTGRCQDGRNQKIEAFRNYLNALGLAENLNNQDLLRNCYTRLSQFCLFCMMIEKALIYKIKERDLIKSCPPIDSVALMWVQYDLQTIEEASKVSDLDENSVRLILDFAIRYGLVRLKNFDLRFTEPISSGKTG